MDNGCITLQRLPGEQALKLVKGLLDRPRVEFTDLVKDAHGFAEYVDMVHTALGDYRCLIEELVSEGDKVFAKMTFTGIHQAEFMGYAPTHKRVSWAGCVLFKFKGERIVDVWVLGDLKSLEEQLKRQET